MKKYIAVLLLMMFSLVSNAQVDRTVKPKPGASKPIAAGEYKSFVAKNGMRVFVVRKAGYPKFRISLNFANPGTYYEKQQEENDLLGDFFDKSSTMRPKKEISEAADEFAATVMVNDDGFVFQGMKGDEGKLMTMVKDYLSTQKFSKKDFDKFKNERIEKLKLEKIAKESKKPQFWQNLKDSLSFHKSPKMEQSKSTLARMERVTLNDVKAYYSKYINTNNCFCMVLGDYTEAEINQFLTKYFKDLKRGDKYEYPTSSRRDSSVLNMPKETKVYVLDNPQAVQSRISIEWPMEDAFPYADNQAVISVMAQIFGESYNSYLNRNLRLDKGLCYGAKCFTSINISGGSNTAVTSVRNKESAYAVENILYEMLRIRNQRVSEEDLAMAKNGMLGDYAVSMSALNSPAVIGFGMVKEQFKLADDYLTTYPKKIEAVTAEDVRSAAQKYILPYNCNIFIEGKVEDIRGTLEKFGNVEYYDKDGNRL